MTWLRLDDGFDEHPKVRDLSPGAFRAHVRAMCWSARQETDGRLTRGVVRDLATKKQRQELVDAGLWDETEDGACDIHDFLQYNPSREQLEAKREATKQRVYEHRKRRSNAVTNTSPGPARPDPDLTPDGVRDARAPDPPPSDPPDLTDSERETPIPLDLLDRARERNVFTDMADKLRVPLPVIEAKASEFLTYWTVGAGAGKRRRHWMARLRKDIHEAHKRGTLPAPGAVAHGHLAGHDTSKLDPRVAAFLAEGGRT